jgi:hypothetical protein
LWTSPASAPAPSLSVFATKVKEIYKGTKKLRRRSITLGTPYNRRTPWFTQSDFNVGHRIKVGVSKAIAFEASAFNVLNQRAITAYYGGMNSVHAALHLKS